MMSTIFRRNGSLPSLLLLLAIATVVTGGLLGRAAGISAEGSKEEESVELSGLDVLTTQLSNGRKLPLVGLGVGNLQHNLISDIISLGMQDDKKIRLIDTAHASRNEAIIADGITRGAQWLVRPKGQKIEVHVVTKVWYTYLGYERTKISVRESLTEMKKAIEDENVDLKLHLLIHWPRCDDSIPWMNCEQEENSLPDSVKRAGPAPHLDKENAWKDTWKAFEDLYESNEYPEIASIGLSNFHLREMEQLESFARIMPHILQANVWSLLFDPHLVHWCHNNRVHIMVYNVMNGVLQRYQEAPNAYNHIRKVANEVVRDKHLEKEILPAQLVLAWLAQHDVSVVPRTSRKQRVHENSAASISSIPRLTEEQSEVLVSAAKALMSGRDVEAIPVKAHFHAVNKNMFLFWVNDAGDLVRLATVPAGESVAETTFPGHSFRAYDHEDSQNYIEYKIQANFGEQEHFHVEL